MQNNKLGRIRGNGAIFGGICAGIAQFLKIQPWIVRLAVILLTLSSGGFAIIVYLALWIFLPVLPKSFVETETKNETKQN